MACGVGFSGGFGFFYKHLPCHSTAKQPMPSIPVWDCLGFRCNKPVNPYSWSVEQPPISSSTQPDPQHWRLSSGLRSKKLWSQRETKAKFKMFLISLKLKRNNFSGNLTFVRHPDSNFFGAGYIQYHIITF